MAVGAEQEKFALEGAKADDKIAADVYAKAGAKVSTSTTRRVKQVAGDRPRHGVEGLRDKSETCAKLLAPRRSCIVA
jgi:porphobilinogen deaminase